MVTKAYIVYNVTQKNEKIFFTQINEFIRCFKNKKVNLIPVSNLEAYEKISKDHNVKFVLFWDKDIALMYELEALGIKLFNNVDAVRLCDDKAYIYAKLLKNNISTPKTIVLPLTFFKEVNSYFKEISSLINKKKIKYPLIVKERRSSLGLGVYLIKDERHLKSIIRKKWKRELIVQEYIDFEYGTDYRVFTVNHRPKAVVTRVNKNDFRSNVEQGGKMSAIKRPDSNLLKLAIKSSLALNLDFGAIDLVKDKNNKYYVLEVNSNARSITIDKIANIKLTQSIVDYILFNI